MKNFQTLLKETRQALQLRHTDMTISTGIDQALLSKYENGNRLPTESHLEPLALGYKLDIKELRKLWLAEKVYNLVKDEPSILEILGLVEKRAVPKEVKPYPRYDDQPLEVSIAAEGRVEYLISKKALIVPALPIEIKEKLMAIDHLKSEWQAKRPLDPAQLRRMREFFNIEYTYESNRIEGNTLSLQETSLVVNQGLTIGTKSMREHLEAINHSEAVDFIVDLASNKEDLDRRSLLDLHILVLKSIDKENAGRWRNVPVRITGSRHEPPQPFMLDKLMEDYFIHYRQQVGVMHPVILAAEIHERLVSIHPFIDGNGRTSRLVMNLILLRNGYTIANLKGDNISRLAYYRALEKVQVDNEPEAFYHLVIDAVETSLKAHLALV